MTSTLVTLLEQHEGKAFMTMPHQSGALERVERALGRALPDDLREVFSRWGGGTLTVPGLTPLGLGPTEGLLDSLDDAEFRENLPGMLVIGDNGGGYVYAYDVEDRLARGAWFLYLVPMGDLGLHAARPVAPTLTVAALLLLDGVHFLSATDPVPPQ